MRLLEFVTEETAVLRNPESEGVIRRFFADAQGSTVRVFDDAIKSGYVFSTPENEESGDFFQLAMTSIQEHEWDWARFQRQVTHGQWYTGKFAGPLHRVAHVGIYEQLDS